MKCVNEVNNNNSTAYLGNSGRYISFSYGNTNIRFKGPYSLEKIVNIVDWNKGYIVVNAKFFHQETPVEDYIDLIPILNNLYINPDNFIKNIEKIEVSNV